jgi:hypothetical protein
VKYKQKIKRLKKINDAYYLLGKKDNNYYCIYKNDVEVNGKDYLLVIFFNNSIVLKKIYFDFIIDIADTIENVSFKVECKYY